MLNCGERRKELYKWEDMVAVQEAEEAVEVVAVEAPGEAEVVALT